MCKRTAESGYHCSSPSISSQAGRMRKCSIVHKASCQESSSCSMLRTAGSSSVWGPLFSSQAPGCGHTLWLRSGCCAPPLLPSCCRWSQGSWCCRTQEAELLLRTSSASPHSFMGTCSHFQPCLLPPLCVNHLQGSSEISCISQLLNI